MKNKHTHRWLDVKVFIATLAMVISLGLWNLFASTSRVDISGQAAYSQALSQSPSSAVQSSTQILLGGSAPQAPLDRQAPVTTTISSRP